MPPKKKKGKKTGKGKGKEDPKKPPAFQKSSALCSFHGPGPKYKLKPVIGYGDHCASRWRGPAYSIAARQTGGGPGSDSPGPIYYADIPRAEGFTFGIAQRGCVPEGGPGPYLLPDPPRRPAFSVRWRTKLRGGPISTPLYNLPTGLNGPSFTIASKLPSDICRDGPGPGPPTSVDPIKPRAPAYSLAFRQTDGGICATPGPYNPFNANESPAFSFGVKHSPCKPPFITDCDEVC